MVKMAQMVLYTAILFVCYALGWSKSHNQPQVKNYKKLIDYLTDLFKVKLADCA